MREKKLFIFSIITLCTSITSIIIILKKIDFNIELSEITVSIIGALLGILLSFLLSIQLRSKKSKKILISYISSDLEEAVKINNYLSAKKINTQLIDSYIPVGEEITGVKNIYKNIDIVIILISKDIHKTKNLKSFISIAINQKKKIFPILIDETKLPNNLSNYTYTDISNNEEYALEDLYKKILSVID